MRRFPILFAAILIAAFSTSPAFAQEAEAPAEDPNAWMQTLVGKVAGSQAGFQNWAEGGVNTLALSLGLDGSAERMSRGWNQKHEMRLSFGVVKQDTLDFRKAEDLIRLASTFTYAGEGFLDNVKPTIALLARSQFANGYNFDKNPFGDDREPPVKVSEFLSPATFTQAVGMTYQARPYVSQRIGIGGKETVVLIEELRPLYNVDIDSSVRLELGIEAFTDFEKEIAQNVVLKSTLGLFAAFNKPDSPDLIWESHLAMKVNSWLQVNVDWAVLYDEDVSSDVQFKEVFSVGVSYSFL